MKTYNIRAKHPNNDTRNILYNIACGVQVPAPALCGTAWSDCVVIHSPVGSPARSVRPSTTHTVRVPWNLYKIVVGKKFRLAHAVLHTPLEFSLLRNTAPDSGLTRYRCTPKFSCRSKSCGCLQQSKFRIYRMSEKFKRAFVQPDQMWGCAMDLWSIRWFR